MWESGMDIEAIAVERELAPGTIEGHLAKAVQSGRINIFKFIPEEEVDIITMGIKGLSGEFTSKDLFIKLEAKYSYAKLRAVMNHVKLNEVDG